MLLQCTVLCCKWQIVLNKHVNFNQYDSYEYLCVSDDVSSDMIIALVVLSMFYLPVSFFTGFRWITSIWTIPSLLGQWLQGITEKPTGTISCSMSLHIQYLYVRWFRKKTNTLNSNTKKNKLVLNIRFQFPLFDAGHIEQWKAHTGTGV